LFGAAWTSGLQSANCVTILDRKNTFYKLKQFTYQKRFTMFTHKDIEYFKNMTFFVGAFTSINYLFRQFIDDFLDMKDSVIELEPELY